MKKKSIFQPILLDLSETKWIPTTGFVTDGKLSNRIVNYEKSLPTFKKLRLEGLLCEEKKSDRKLIEIEGKKICFDKTCLTRIGTPSLEGEVYSLSFDHTNIAMKVMPIVDAKSAAKNKNEIEIATLASQSVRDKKTSHFPLVYASSHCNHTLFSDRSLFKIPSELWGLRSSLAARLSSSAKVKVFLARTSQLQTPEEILEVARTFFPGEEVNKLTKLWQTPSDLLFSELAYSDLRQYLMKHKLSKEQWGNVIRQLVEAIEDLSRIHIVHNDLHLGNVLVLLSSGSLMPFLLIHDFGKSEIQEKGSEWKNLVDLRQAIDDILLLSDTTKNVPKDVIKILTKISNDLTQSIKPYEERNL